MKKNIPVNRLVKKIISIFMAVAFFSSCGRDSSPEGRMSIKLEELQKTMTDSLMLHNRAILDSLGKIRAELNELKQLHQ